MIKKILSAIFVIAIAAVAAWNVNKNNSKEVAMSDLALENVEALAGGETGDGYAGITYKEGDGNGGSKACACWGSGNVKCCG